MKLIDWCKLNNKEELLSQWDKDKNSKRIEDVTHGSKYKAFWICPNGHSFQCSISERTIKGNGCNICSKRLHTSYPEQAVFFYVKQAFPDAINSYRDIFKDGKTELDIYIPSLRVGIEYDGFRYHSNMKKQMKDGRKYRICRANKIGLIRIIEGGLPSGLVLTCDHRIFIPNQNDSEIEYAINELLYHLGKSVSVNLKQDKLVIKQYYQSLTSKNLATEYPEISNEWDYEKNNDLIPSMFSPCVGDEIWWKCKKGHSYQSKISNRVHGLGCPYCSGRYAIKGENDFATLHPELLSMWDYEKNNAENIYPDEVKSMSDAIVHWVCPKCGYQWPAPVKSISKGCKCRLCGIESSMKKRSKKVYCYSLEGKLIETYPSVQEASRKTGIAASTLNRACNKKGKDVINNFYWTYSNNFEFKN